jgi:hypothetical protein
LHFAQVRTNIIVSLPAKPKWYSNIDDIVRKLENLPRLFVDRATIEHLFGVGRRRAQQILSPCVTDRVGSNGVADRTALISYLRHLGNKEEAYYERRRRRSVAASVSNLQRQWSATPPLMIQAPDALLEHKVENLPDSIRLERGRITLTFTEPHEAVQQMIALATAIAKDPHRFRALVQLAQSKTLPARAVESLATQVEVAAEPEESR